MSRVQFRFARMHPEKGLCNGCCKFSGGILKWEKIYGLNVYSPYSFSFSSTIFPCLFLPVSLSTSITPRFHNTLTLVQELRKEINFLCNIRNALHEQFATE